VSNAKSDTTVNGEMTVKEWLAARHAQAIARCFNEQIDVPVRRPKASKFGNVSGSRTKRGRVVFTRNSEAGEVAPPPARNPLTKASNNAGSKLPHSTN
jgi:hypothetical protein